jgi:hypothetical protein
MATRGRQPKARQWLATIHVRKSIATNETSTPSNALIPDECIEQINVENPLNSHEFSVKNNNFALNYTPKKFLSPEVYPKNLVFACGQWERCPNMADAILNDPSIHPDQGLHLQMFFRFNEQLTVPKTIETIGAVSWISLTPVTIDRGASTYPLKEETREPGMEQFSFKIGYNNTNEAPPHREKRLADAIRACATQSEYLEIEGVAHCFSWANAVWADECNKRARAALIDESSLTFGTLLDKQQDIVSLRENLEPRKILILHDPIGGWGKTQLSKWLVCHKRAFLTQGGDKEKTMKAFIDFQAGETPSPWVIFDYPRAKEMWSYTSMEAFADGNISHQRYTGGYIKINPGCLVLVMCNSIPEDIEQKLSKDRLHIINLTQHEPLAPGINNLNNTAFSND